MKCDKHGIATDCPECVHSDLWESFNRDITKLTQERDQLQARVAELESGVDTQMRVIGGLQALIQDLRGWLKWAKKEGATDRDFDLAIESTPAQSLAAIEARVLREFGSKVAKEGWNDFPNGNIGSAIKRWADYEADRIEKEGKV